jgi:hypothetical protein
MVLGPVVADRELGGAGQWGVIAAALGIGTLLGSGGAARLRPARPMLAMSLLCLGPALMAAALGFPLIALAIAVVALLAGATEGVVDVIWVTALQQRVPSEALSRVSAYDSVGSFVLMPVGFALAGPVAEAVGTRATLLGSAALGAFAALAVASVPSVRGLRRLEAAPEVVRPAS